MKSRPQWDEYFLKIVHVVASRSTCLRQPKGVGAVIVRDKQILSSGYAGSIKGQPHCTDDGVGCLIDEKTGGCIRTVHAETNSILQAAQNGVSILGATMYCSLSPCWDCFKAMANGGIRRIVFDRKYRIFDRQETAAPGCGIELIHLPISPE